MDKIARTDWKRHSAPYDYTFDFTVYNTPVDAVVDQAMQAFTADAGQQKTSTIGRERKKSTCVVDPEKTELSTDQYTPGVLKVFGETIFPGVQYKSVLASCRSTAQELVKEALERFGLSAEDYERFVLCDVVGRYEHDVCESRDTEIDVPKSDKWDRVFTRMLADRDKPLLLQKFWKPIDGYSRRYELHERAHVTDVTDDDDTSGLNQNARKILISKLRPGAIPLFDASSLDRDSDGLKLNVNTCIIGKRMANLGSHVTNGHTQTKKMCSAEQDTAIPSKHPFFVNIRGFDVEKDRTIYVIKSKRFTFGNPNLRNQHAADDTPKFSLFAPDIEPIHCNVKVYKFKKSNGVSDSVNDRNNYFLELEPLVENVCVNGHRIHGKILVKSGDIINIGIYYVLLFKDCSKGNDIPLSLPWLPVPDMSDDNEVDNSDLKLNLANGEDESNSNTDESVDASIAERMSFAYTKEKEEELVKYICAIIQQQNTCKTYSLTVAFLFSMCIEHASRKFDRRQLKHLFLRILFTVRENVAETAKSLSACKFSCTLLDASLPPSDRDRKLERLLLWISNCVQLLLFLKHTFQLPELPLSDRGSVRGRDDKASRKEENAKHALGQLVTGLEEIIMFCFQQCVYTITKALHPVLPALLDSNPFSDANSEQCSMEDVIRMFERLAEVTHSVMLHEGITRQLFTYLFFFTNTNIFNKLIVDESGVRYYNWQCGVRVRANLSQLEDWATQNGLEDEFSQMFERLLAMSELLATSKNTLVKYQWPMMKTHYQPLSPGQLHHILSHYQMNGKATPVIWTPSQEEMEQIREEDIQQLPLSNHPPFALPDNCGVVDLIRSPEDTSFWNHLRRLKSLYGVTEDDSDSGFSISNTPRGSCSATTKSDFAEPFFEQENKEMADENETSERRASHPESSLMMLLQKQKSRIPVKKCNTNPWSFKVPKPGTGVCNCANVPADELATSGTLASDLMKEEHREQPESNEHSKDPRETNTVRAKSSERRAQNNAQVACKTEQKGKQLVQRYQKSVPSGNVADCSARTLPKSLQIKERNKLKQLQSRISQAHSFSVDDLPLRLLKHRPSASFEEAIERGYTSDTYHSKSASISEAEEDTLTKEKTQEVKPEVKTRVPRNGIRRHKSLVTDSVSSDEVFHSENNIDNLYKDYLSDINAQPLPNKMSFKPLPTSVNPQLKLRTNAQKMTSVSFEPESRRSSIELTRDDLFISNANHLKRANTGIDDDGADDIFEPETSEAFPGELFTEVNESTLAALKRHGSSLNVAPSSENSPRTVSYEQVSEVLGSDEKKRMSPCPLFTVYLKRGDTGLGLGLIDGLHTPLRLAGIYIRKILPNSPAALNGCLQIGDRVLAVDGKSVIGASYQSTMNAIKDAGDTLTLLVARGNESMARKVSVSQV
ncbi:ras-associating and dilute domain-containing protein-like [Mercenaria mercenaria]|uniref:ras-associating and dilute domain-containing protein-like n=1 Tax=Mercenaria mercenaria TaxID=6596 RepID=UPI00234E457F|nr:ras-associating and dilute domain-containing protein-like [Mercenaria mercenaria]XP_053384428.1 ras-associating and dilute domain-containing protein-like [Mercenaria mercenaria]XP_053384432.1 ras-associating and dilute domain-containing protein-like [Mercenaria mercenaria]XP_053384437.1 ras-associating and dilute domain-containing protein-like [Mercenaria mercenaria]XP_053384440.1 ras-associating and dilute domain-containing protein-like [Mercenaria mercenaria]